MVEQYDPEKRKAETASTLGSSLSNLLRVKGQITGIPTEFRGSVSELTGLLLGESQTPNSDSRISHNLREVREALSWLSGLVEDRLAQGSQGNGNLQ